MKRLVSVKSLVVALLLAPALAVAQPKTADDWYKEGENQYNLGDFDKAADAFKQGFSAETDDSKKPAYLYNVAQSYRQGGKCKDAAFFYKRYLALKDQDTVKPLKPEKRTEVEGRITEMEQCANGGATTTTGTGTTTTTPKTGTGTGTTTTTTTTPKTGTTGATTGTTGTTTTTPKTGTTTTTSTTPKTGGTGTTTNGGTTVTTTTTTTPPRPTAPKAGGDTTKPKHTTTTVAQVNTGGDTGGEHEVDEYGASTGALPKLVSARFLLGGSRVGAGDLDVGVRGSFALLGGYPVFKKDKLLVEAGAALTYTPVVYHNAINDADEVSSIFDILVNAGATYAIAQVPKLSARGDLGVGMQSWSGLKMGNPFVDGRRGTDGALTTFALRFGVSADYAITPNIVATATPFAFTYSPAKSGLRSDISSITQIQFMVGVGYRM